MTPEMKKAIKELEHHGGNMRTRYEMILAHLLDAMDYLEAARTRDAATEFIATWSWARKTPGFKNTAEFAKQRADVLYFMLDNGVGLEALPPKPPTGPTHGEPQWGKPSLEAIRREIVKRPIVRDNATYNAGFAEGIKYACIVVASIIQNSQVKLPDDDAYNPMGEAFLHGLRRMSEEAWAYRDLNK